MAAGNTRIYLNVLKLPGVKITTAHLMILIFLLSFAMRLFYNQSVIFKLPLIRNDAIDYYFTAENLFDYGIYSKKKSSFHPPTPDSFRPPLLPLIIFVTMSAVQSKDEWYGYVIFFQIILGALIALLIFYLAIMVSIPIWGAFIAALLTTFDPCLVTVTGYLLPEVYVSFFILLFFALFFRSELDKNIALIALSSLAGVLLFFSREEYLFVPLIISFFHFREWPKGYLVFILIFLILPAIWIIRKETLPESPSRLRIAAYEGSLPFTEVNGSVKYRVARLPQYKKFEPMKKSWAEFSEIIIKRIWDSPKLILWYFPVKSYYLLHFNFLQGDDVFIYPVIKSIWQEPLFNSLKKGSKFLFYCCIPLSIFGIYLNLIKKDMLAGIALVLLFYFVFFHLFVPLPKYMIPFRPLMYLFALFSITYLIDKHKHLGQTKNDRIAAPNSFNS